MNKIKYNRFITTKQIDNILVEKYPEKICPDCKQNKLYAGCIESQFDDKSEEDIVLSFQVFCNGCGHLVGAWDNTNRQRFI